MPRLFTLGIGAFYNDGGNIFPRDTDSGVRLHLPIGSATDPPLTIGESDSGLYGVSDVSLGVTLDGAVKFFFLGNELRSASGNDAISIATTLATATAPPYSFRGDTDTGMGKAGADMVSLIAGAAEGLRITEAGGTIEADFQKVRITALGGIAVKLTNETGANSVAGELVKADTANDDAVVLTGAADTECFGVFYESGIADGAEAWVVVSGIADVMLEDTTASTRGNYVETSGTGGRADATAASPPGVPQHFQEIGHCIETKTGGTDVLARCILHFN